MNKLHPDAKVIFYSHWLTVFLTFSIFILFIPFFFFVDGDLSAGSFFLLFSIVLVIILFLPLILASLSYDNYRYELQDDRVYIERGIIWKKHVTIPYERVQNVDIHRGPLARMFSLSDLQIQTAGATKVWVEGKIPGISFEEAPKLRDRILTKVSGTNQGL